MAIKTYSELEDYELVNDEQDCRGWTVVNSAGNRLGTVNEMLVDTDSEMVAALVLDSGEQIPARDVSLNDGKVVLRGTNKAVSAATAKEEITVPVIEEQIRVGKRAVETGGVHVSRRVTEKPVEKTVTLRDEALHVDRRPANRQATEADLAQVKEGVVEFAQLEERAVVNKEPVVVEEIVIGKEVTAHDETIQDTIKRTEVEVEEFDAKNKSGAAR